MGKQLVHPEVYEALIKEHGERFIAERFRPHEKLALKPQPAPHPSGRNRKQRRAAMHRNRRSKPRFRDHQQEVRAARRVLRGKSFIEAFVDRGLRLNRPAPKRIGLNPITRAVREYILDRR